MSDSLPTIVETVEGIGTFTFHRRRMRQDIACQMEFRRLTEGVPVDGFQGMFLQAIADLKVLILQSEAPVGWLREELDELDPYDDAVYGQVLKVWSALRGKEETFRGARAAVQAEG